MECSGLFTLVWIPWDKFLGPELIGWSPALNTEHSVSVLKLLKAFTLRESLVLYDRKFVSEEYGQL